MNKDDWFAADMAFIISNVQRELKEEKEAREREEAEWSDYDPELEAKVNAVVRRVSESRPKFAPIEPMENSREWKVATPSSVFMAIFFGIILSLLPVLVVMNHAWDFRYHHENGFVITVCVIMLLAIWGFVIHFIVHDYFIPKRKMKKELKRQRMEKKQRLQESGMANEEDACPEQENAVARSYSVL